MEEVWKPVTVYNSKLEDGRWKYEVSSFGNVRSNAFGRARVQAILTRTITANGYCTVSLRDDSGVSHMMPLGKLVAMAFIPNPDNFARVEHIDGNPINNYASNLRWSQDYIVIDKKEKKTATPRKSSRVRQYSADGKFIKEYNSAAEAARAVYLSNNGCILDCCHRKPGRHLSAGFIWRFPWDDEFERGGSE